MKIAFIGQKGIPATGGGVENYVENLSTRLAKRGNEVVVFTRSHYAPEGEFKRVQVRTTPGINTKSLDAITHTLTAVWESFFIPDLDILHINSVGPALFTPLARIGFGLKKLLGGHTTKVIFTFHSADWYHGKWNLIARFGLRLGAWLGTHFAHEVITVSKSLQKVSRLEFGVEATYIPNGAAFSHITSDSELEAFGLTKQSYIVFISRLIPHKNAHVLIEAYHKMSKNFGKKLVIVGGGVHTSEYEQKLHTLAKGDPNIVFTGFQSGRTLKQLFANAALYILPSSSEGLSISLLEAGSYGVPIVISNIPENREIVGDLGYVAELNDADSLAEEMQDALTDYRHAQEKANILQQEIKYHYAWPRIVTAIEAVYQRNLEPNGVVLRRAFR